MKKLILKSAVAALALITAFSFAACSFGAKEYNATDDSYFKFEYRVVDSDSALSDDGSSDDGVGEVATDAYYAISAKNVNDLPDEVRIPKAYDDGIHGNLPIVVAENGFYGAAIKEVYFPLNVKSIGKNAFAKCENLTTAYFYKGNGLQEIGESAFFGDVALSGVDFPKSLRSIGNYAFWGCVKIESIELPEKVNSIGNGAFAYCTALRYFYIPTHLQFIGEGAFSGCESISYKVSQSNKNYYIKDGQIVKR